MDRDRDEQGRARSRRPRDRLGRPLPRTQVGVELWDESTVLTPELALVTAQRLLDDGLPFQAHEVLESAWKSAPAGERAVWQGLAQLAVGVTHAARGNPNGARTLLRRGRDRVAAYADEPPHCIDATGLVQWVDDSLTALTDSDSTPMLLASPRLVARPATP
jgi:uncharacterized protein